MVQGLESPWKLFSLLFQDLECLRKWNWALNVLEFDVRGPRKSFIFNTSESSLPHCKWLCSRCIAPNAVFLVTDSNEKFM